MVVAFALRHQRHLRLFEAVLPTEGREVENNLDLTVRVCDAPALGHCVGYGFGRFRATTWEFVFVLLQRGVSPTLNRPLVVEVVEVEPSSNEWATSKKALCVSRPEAFATNILRLKDAMNLVKVVRERDDVVTHAVWQRSMSQLPTLVRSARLHRPRVGCEGELVAPRPKGVGGLAHGLVGAARLYVVVGLHGGVVAVCYLS